MKRTGVSACVFLVCLFCAATLQAQAPGGAEPQSPTAPSAAAPAAATPEARVLRLVRFTGELRDAMGRLRTGVLGVTFALYEQQEGGVARWLETQNIELDAQGRYSVLLGVTRSEGLPLELFTSGEARWLGIQVEGDPAERERVLLVSVPYALKAADADTLGGKPASAFVLAGAEAGSGRAPATARDAQGSAVLNSSLAAAGGAGGNVVRGTGTLNFIPIWLDTSTIGNSILFQSGGNVGIGTTTPAEKLDVVGNLKVSGGVTAASFSGSGAALTNVNAALLGGLAASAFAPAAGSSVYVAKAGDTMAGTLNLPANGLVAGTNQLVLAGGKVGVGTATPTEKLEVAGLVKAVGYLGDGSLLTVDGSTASALLARIATLERVVDAVCPPGCHLWSERFGSAGDELGRSVAVDASGNVLVTGYFQGTVDFGGGGLTSSAGSLDIFVAKFGPDGSHLWSKRFGDTLIDSGISVAVDESGNVLVTGYFQGTVDFGGGALTSPGGYDIFLAKFSGADGSHLWSKRFGSTGGDVGNGVAVDASGNVLVTGIFEATVDFGGGALTSAGFEDIFVAKFAGADGAHLWSQRFGSTIDDSGWAVAVDPTGNVLVTGYFQGTVDFGGGALTSAGARDVFVAKFSGTDGSHLWSKRFGSTANDYGDSVAVDGSSNVLVTGQFTGTVDFGGGALTSAGNVDIFVAKFSGADGAHLWSKRFGGTVTDTGRTVAVDASGNVVVAGVFQFTVDFGGGALTSAGGSDIFVAKFSGADGAHLWSKRFGSTSNDEGFWVGVDASGNVLVTGCFQGTVDFGGGALTSAGRDDIFLIQLRR